MALNNFNSFHNFNVAQQQRANASKGNTPAAQGENPQPLQQNAHKGQGRQTMRNRNQSRGNKGQMRNAQQQRFGTAAMPQQGQMPQMQNMMPQQQMQGMMPQQGQMPQMQNAMHTQPQMQNMMPQQGQSPQMQNAMHTQPQMQQGHVPQMQSPMPPPVAVPPDQQVAQYMKGETSGIPINEENINHLIKTLNESDAQKNQIPSPAMPAGAKMPVPGTGTMIGRPQGGALGENALEKLAQHIQNEANGAAFYLHLTRIAPSGLAKQNFDDISERCRQRAEAYSRIYSEKSGKKFEPKNVVINNQVSIKDGIQLALNEERKNISDLFALYEEINDAKTEKSINCQIFRKLIDLHVLMDMRNQ